MNSIGRKIFGARKFNTMIFVIFLSLASLLFTLLLAGCGNRGDAGGGSSQATALDPLPLTDDSLRQIVTSSLIDKNNLRNADLTGEGAERTVNIGINRPVDLENGMVEANMALVTQKVMPALFEFPEISRVTITMYGVEQGIRSDGVAVRASVDRASVKDIDWSTLGPVTLSWSIPDYYVNPAITGISNPGESGTAGMDN